MIKTKELSDPTSCINVAHDDELVFVLLARDLAAPGAIRHWADARVNLGKNKETDAQIVEARACASRMDITRADVRDRVEAQRIADRKNRAQAFIDDIVATCRQHGMALTHEDQHGAFIVDDIRDGDLESLRRARVEMLAARAADETEF
jgi:hypothetical protein